MSINEPAPNLIIQEAGVHKDPGGFKATRIPEILGPGGTPLTEGERGFKRKESPLPFSGVGRGVEW